MTARDRIKRVRPASALVTQHDLDDVYVREVIACVSSCIDRALHGEFYAAGGWMQLARTNKERVLDAGKRDLCYAMVENVNAIVVRLERAAPHHRKFVRAKLQAVKDGMERKVE